MVTSANRMEARTIDLSVFVFIGFPFEIFWEWGSKDTGETPLRGILQKRKRSPPLAVPTQARACTKFNRKQEEKVRNSIK
jgi:hypothetical protein